MNGVRAAIVAVGGANFASLLDACARIGVGAVLTDDPIRIANATHVLLPGVGAAGPAMRSLRERGLDRVLARLRQPLLGVCLGMQLLFERSDEGEEELLGLLSGNVTRLAPAPIWPHMGWNTLQPAAGAHALLRNIAADDWFYFVHGFAAHAQAHMIASAEFGSPFAAIIARGNISGVQFHPEKSAHSGRQLLRNFFAS